MITVFDVIVDNWRWLLAGAIVVVYGATGLVADESIARSIAMKARAMKEAQAELARAEMQAEIVSRLDRAAADLDPAGWRLKTLEVLVELTPSAQSNTILIPANLTEFADVLSAWRSGKNG